jgi:acetyltransferase
VITGITSELELRAAIERLRGVVSRSGLDGARTLLQETRRGRELIYGIERDRAFGPVAMFGLGGTLVEALHDVAFAVAPVSSYQAAATIRSIRSFRLLEAFRGERAVALSSLVDLLTALSQLAVDLPEVAEVDLNPVIANANGAAVVDILVRL